MNKRGLIVFASGLVLVGISLSIAVSVIPSDIVGPNDLSMSVLFEGMFDDSLVSNHSVFTPPTIKN